MGPPQGHPPPAPGQPLPLLGGMCAAAKDPMRCHLPMLEPAAVAAALLCRASWPLTVHQRRCGAQPMPGSRAPGKDKKGQSLLSLVSHPPAPDPTAMTAAFMLIAGVPRSSSQPVASWTAASGTMETRRMPCREGRELAVTSDAARQIDARAARVWEAVEGQKPVAAAAGCSPALVRNLRAE